MSGVPEAEEGTEASDSMLLDSYARDLTVNAICYDLKTGDILDFHGGLKDVKEQVLRMVSHPDVTLKYTPSRIIRILRFLARYEDSTLSQDLEDTLREYCQEYIRLIEPFEAQNQIRRLWISGYAAACFDKMVEYDVLGYFYPAVVELCATEAYRTEVREALAGLDAKVARGESVVLYMGTAELLLPAVRELMETMSAEEAVEEALKQMDPVYGFFGEERANTAAYLLELLSAEQEEKAA